MNKIILITLVVLVIVVGAIFVWRDYALAPLIDSGLDDQNVNQGDLNRHQLEDTNLSFAYPNDYVLVEGDNLEVGVVSSVALFDASEYEEFRQSVEAREGPPAITIEAFELGSYDDLSDWIQNNPRSNWNLGSGALESQIVADRPAFAYDWSGLYAGQSTAILHDGLVYVLSVQYLSADDQIVEDFADLLDTISFTDPQNSQIEWPEAISLIEDCQVAIVAQTHNLDIYLTTKDGRRLVTQAPQIDIVFDYVTGAADECGMIPLATE